MGGRRRGHRRAGQGAFVAQQGLDGSHRFGPLVIRHRDGQQGGPVLVVGLHRGGVLHLQRDGDVQDVVQPGDGGNALDAADLLFEGQRFGNGDVPHHGPHIGDAAAEGLLHHVDGDGGRGFGGR